MWNATYTQSSIVFVIVIVSITGFAIIVIAILMPTRQFILDVVKIKGQLRERPAPGASAHAGRPAGS